MDAADKMMPPASPSNEPANAKRTGSFEAVAARLNAGGPQSVTFWGLALVIGVLAGLAAVWFRVAVFSLQGWLYGTDDPSRLHSFAQSLPWYWIVLLPVVGGAVVGLILHFFTPDNRVRSVADVIAGAALNDGRVERKAGIASAIASIVTLSSGGSSGREGPVVHLAALISSWIAERFKADGITGRDLLGCAVAAAVSASFNAPIAGALFALEVVLRHFAVHAFAPIAIASVTGTVISRWHFGDVTEFTLPVGNLLEFYVELPAFVMLGLICGGAAALVMRVIFWADDLGNNLQERLRLPPYLRPVLAGLVLGLIATQFPHIIGVGYETTSAALTGEILLREAVIFAVVKAVAMTVTLAGRMGGGVFSPSLMVGALTGLSFGLIATTVLPDISGSETLYALAGMGAVAAAVLGAPISTALIVFELTGDWQTGVAVLVAVSASTAVASRLVNRSYFLTQLERGNLHLAAGPQAYLLEVLRTGVYMRPDPDGEWIDLETVEGLVARGLWLEEDSTLDKALALFESTGRSEEYLPVLEEAPDRSSAEIRAVGLLYHVDALRAYNRALAATAAEEHS